MSLISTEDAEALMATGLDPDALQGVIDREEAWLADDPEVGIGELTGERTVRIWRQPGDAEPILLTRPTAGNDSSGDAIVVDDGGTLRVDVVRTGPARLEATDAAWSGPWIHITYTPNDRPAVERVLFELVRLAVTASPYRQESTEGHSYTRPLELQKMREDLARSLRPHRGPGTLRLGTGATHRITSPVQ